MVPVTAADPKPGEFPVVWLMPPVTDAAGSSADLRLTPVEPLPVASLCVPLASTIWKAPENVPLAGNVKFAFTAPCASLATDVTFMQFVKPCGYGQNCMMNVELFCATTACTLPAPLLAVVSMVTLPWGAGFLPTVKNHVERNASEAAAGVGLGDGTGVGDGTGLGDGMGVGVGVGPILLETEPQPTINSKSPVKRMKRNVRTKSSLEPELSVKKGNVDR